MAKLSDLGLSNEKVGQADLDYGTMPEQMGGFAPPPQPGPFRFKLPANLDAIWDTFDKTTGNNPGQRVAAVFDDQHPLVIVQSVNNEYTGDPFTTRVTNAERKRGRADDPLAQEVSDLDYLLRDAFGVRSRPKNATNIWFCQELMKFAGQEFSADIEWSYRCNPARAIRVDNGQGGFQEMPEQMGCGTRYYQKDVPKDESGKLPLHITCTCGNNVRGFANLTRFRK